MIGVIGCGNMASAIVRGMYQKDKELSFKTYTPSFTRAEKLAKEINAQAVKELSELNDVDHLIIACKPQQFSELSSKLSAELDTTNKHIISIMAAISCDKIAADLRTRNITRVMPNTPSKFGAGISLIFHDKDVKEEDRELTAKIFNYCSETFAINDEKKFDHITTISGSGPAYVFYFTHLFAEKLMKWGLPNEEAVKMSVELMRGSAELMRQHDGHNLSELIDQVTSKGGVTIEAMNSFKEQNLREVFSQAIDSACRKTKRLKQELN